MPARQKIKEREREYKKESIHTYNQRTYCSTKKRQFSEGESDEEA